MAINFSDTYTAECIRTLVRAIPEDTNRTTNLTKVYDELGYIAAIEPDEELKRMVFELQAKFKTHLKAQNHLARRYLERKAKFWGLI